MKSSRLSYAFLTLLAVAAFTSCTKNYTCHCTISYSGQPGLPDTTVQQYSIQDTRSGAKSKCSGASATYKNNGITTTENCTLF